jgi:hypothetical protein
MLPGWLAYGLTGLLSGWQAVAAVLAVHRVFFVTLCCGGGGTLPGGGVDDDGGGQPLYKNITTIKAIYCKQYI